MSALFSFHGGILSNINFFQITLCLQTWSSYKCETFLPTGLWVRSLSRWSNCIQLWATRWFSRKNCPHKVSWLMTMENLTNISQETHNSIMTENNQCCRTDNNNNYYYYYYRCLSIWQFTLHQEQTPRIWGKLLCLEKKYDVSYNQENYHN